MIKINLLPSYIHEKQVVRQLAALFAIIIVATAVAGVTYKMKLDTATNDMRNQANAVEAEKARIKGINDQAQQELAKIGPITAKLQFIKQIEAYNEIMPNLYQELAKYTYKGILYRKVTPGATALQIEAYTPSLSDLGRYLLNMYKAESIFSSVAISAIPGYPAAEGVSVVSGGSAPAATAYYPGMSTAATRYGGLEAVTSGVSKTVKEKGFNFSVVCNLKAPIAAPAGPGGAASSGTTPGAMPGAMPMQAPPPPPPPPSSPSGAGTEDMNGRM